MRLVFNCSLIKHFIHHTSNYHFSEYPHTFTSQLKGQNVVEHDRCEFEIDVEAPDAGRVKNGLSGSLLKGKLYRKPQYQLYTTIGQDLVSIGPPRNLTRGVNNTTKCPSQSLNPLSHSPFP